MKIRNADRHNMPGALCHSYWRLRAHARGCARPNIWGINAQNCACAPPRQHVQGWAGVPSWDAMSFEAAPRKLAASRHRVEKHCL